MTVYDLWLPIVVAGVATHILSTLFWTAFPHHKPEWNKLPVEDDFIDWVEARQVPANQYIFPHAEGGADAGTPEFKAKQSRCRGMLVLWPAPIGMGPAIVKTLLFFLFAAFSVGYVASLALQRDAAFGEVFRFVTTVGLLTHIYAKFPAVFWFQQRIAMSVLDGVAYAVATGLIFASMWPVS